MQEMGAGLLTLCVVLLLLAAMSIITLVIVWNYGNEIIAQYGDEASGAVFYQKLLAALKPLLFLASAAALFFSSKRMAVYLTISAFIYNSYGTAIQLFHAVMGISQVPFNIFGLLNIAALIAAVGYLLLSKEVERVYEIGTRKLLTRGIANLWQRGRGRPTSQEIEADRLNDTFR